MQRTETTVWICLDQNGIMINDTFSDYCAPPPKKKNMCIFILDIPLCLIDTTNTFSCVDDMKQLIYENVNLLGTCRSKHLQS